MGWGLNKRIPPDKAELSDKAKVSELLRQREESNDEGMEESEDKEDESGETTRLLFGGNGKLERERTDEGEPGMKLELPPYPRNQDLPITPPKCPKPRSWIG